MAKINLTKQEAFNRVVKHLREQGRKSQGPCGVYCRYRNYEGLKCAVGALIPDELYDPEMEQGGGIEANERVRQLFPDDLLLMLKALQLDHDYHAPEDWEHCLQITADYFGLEMPE